MDMLDLGIISALESVYDAVDHKYGRVAAWIVTLVLVGVVASIIIWTLVRFVFR